MLLIEKLQARICRNMVQNPEEVPIIFNPEDRDNVLRVHRQTRGQVLRIIGRHLRPEFARNDDVVTKYIDAGMPEYAAVSIAIQNAYNTAIVLSAEVPEYRTLITQLNAEAEIVRNFYGDECDANGITLLHETVRHGIRTVVSLQTIVGTKCQAESVSNISKVMQTAPRRFMTALMQTSGAQAVHIEKELGWHCIPADTEHYGMFEADAFRLTEDDGVHLDITADMFVHLQDIKPRSDVFGCMAHEVSMGTATNAKVKQPSWIQAIAAESHRLLTKFWLPNLQK